MESKSNDSEPRLILAWEAWDGRTDQFAYLVMLWKKDGDFYHKRHLSRDYTTDDPNLFNDAILVPRTYYTAEPLPELTRASQSPQDPAIYVKKHKPIRYKPVELQKESTGTPADDMLHEAQVCEALMKSKHPNICEYFGYLRSEDGRMEGLRFKRHGKSLLDSVRDKEELDTAVVIKGISEGLKHLHSLHYAHNDVKPDNVVLDAQAGTPGWSKEADVSEPGNDFYGLEKIVQWLQTPV
ncbi:hypothetical protein B0H10DRAFT_1239729 [Mycena sp. CBHHK59/15]|nr:hypothetical protein B0H10DRAFT_1239729 [Mycena sp. CBHHK59/15]